VYTAVVVPTTARITTLFMSAIVMAIASLTFGCNVGSVAVVGAAEVRGTGHLVALSRYAKIASNRRDSFSFDEQIVASTMHRVRGDVLKVGYIDRVPSGTPEFCAIEPCTSMSNQHFRGLTIPPEALQDDVLDMMAAPGQTHGYSPQISPDHLPGLFWCQPYLDEDSNRQMLDRMSGAVSGDGCCG
jgi:hypothetical protein